MRVRTGTAVVVAALCVMAWARGRADDAEKPAPNGIAWYATWDRALRVAQETGRPIMLLAAAPQCHGVSGIW